MKEEIRKIVNTPVFAMLGGNAAASVMGLLTFAWLGRDLGSADFGLWVLFTTATSMADLIRTGLVKTGLLWSYAKSEEHRRKGLHGSAFLLMILISIAISALVLLIAYVFPTLPNALSLELFFEYYPGYCLVSIPHFFISWRLQAEQRFGPSQIGRFLLNSSFLGFIAVGSYLAFGLLEVVNGYLFIHGLSSIFHMIRYGSFFQSLLATNRKDLTTLYRYGRSSLATLAGGSLLRGTDLYLLGIWLGPEAVAIYSIPMKIIDLLDIPLRSIVGSAFGSMVRTWNGKLNNAFHQKLHYLILIGTGLSLMVVTLSAFCSGWIINFFQMGEEVSTYLVFYIFCVAMLIMPMEKFLGVAFDATGQPGRNATKVWVMLSLNIVGDVVMLYFFQSMVGVALVTVLNQLLGILYSTRFFKISYTNFRRVAYQIHLRMAKKWHSAARPLV